MKITALMVFSLLASSGFAQITPYSPPPPPPPPPTVMNAPDVWGARYFHFGLNITPGIYWVSPTTSNNTANGASFGFSYGANLEFYFTRNYGFLTGFEIADIGAKYINTVSSSNIPIDSTVTHNETIQYLQIPLELKLKTVPFRHLRYYGVVGLELGFRLKATDNSSTIDYANFRSPPGSVVYNEYTSNNVNINGETDFFRVSLVLGVGVEYSLAGSTALQACLSYNNCFTNMNSSGNDAANLKGIELMFGLLF